MQVHFWEQGEKRQIHPRLQVHVISSGCETGNGGMEQTAATEQKAEPGVSAEGGLYSGHWREKKQNDNSLS